jgi:hypothetical protein
MIRAVFPIVSLVALGAVASACTTTVSAEPIPVATSGALVVDWSINGTKDPNACFQSASATLEVQIFTDFGAAAGTFEQACTAFATTISLSPGRYTANALLLDGVGNPRTTAVPINPFTIVGNDQLDIPIDFPASSFF